MNRRLADPFVSPNITVENITTYLLRTGWEHERYPGKHLLVFRYYRNDDKNEPIRLVLPDRMDYGDWELRSKEALDLLAFIEGRTLDIIVNEIRGAEEVMGVHDIITMRILNDFTRVGSISLDLAHTIVNGLRDLVATTAATARDARPHYSRLPGVGTLYTQKFRFAHTFPGSFGFTIQSPPLVPPKGSFLEVSDEVVPFERRITERIIRGLHTLNKATTEGNLDLLIESYDVGMNSNMGQALLDMAGDKQQIQMEYSVYWAPIYSPPDDIQNLGSVELKERNYWFIQDAIRAWQQVEPRKITLYGKIEILRSSPRETYQRQVRIHTKLPEEGDINVRVALDGEDYRQACDAHRDNRTIVIEGILERVGRSWILRNPYDFRVI